jgi:RNA polymerase sigma-70 factor (ECF subfamily)
MRTENDTVIENLLPDEEIIDLYWKRDEKAIEATDKKYGKYLYTIAYNIIHDKLDCEECVNDTYLGVWNRIPPAKPNKFQVFCARIMRNIAIDRFRKHTASKRIPSELVVSLNELDNCMTYESSMEDQYAIREMSRILNSYLRAQSATDEFMFVCRYYYMDSVANIAKMLDMNEKAVYRKLVEMRNELKALLEKEGLYHE